MQPHDAGIAGFVGTFDLKTIGDGQFPVERFTTIGGPQATAAVLRAHSYKAFQEEDIERIARNPSPVFTASEAVGAARQAAYWKRADMPGANSLMIKGATPSGRLIVVATFLPEVRSSTAEERSRWGRVSAHLAAALRLRIERAEPEAVLEPGGKLVHAETPAQGSGKSLRAAAVAIDRARGKLRRTEPDEAMNLWLGLVEGRWSLVDRFDSDGRRYVVAHRNDPRLARPRALTMRERQVVDLAAHGYSNKLIAYALGTSTSAVATLLARASNKLRVGSRTELVALARRLATPAR
jgi:DNA-binding CsgD family transcriptional regulator